MSDVGDLSVALASLTAFAALNPFRTLPTDRSGISPAPSLGRAERVRLFLLITGLGLLVGWYADRSGFSLLATVVRVLVPWLGLIPLLSNGLTTEDGRRAGSSGAAASRTVASSPRSGDVSASAPVAVSAAAPVAAGRNPWMDGHLGEEGELLETIINNTSSVIFVKDLEGRYLLANNQHKKLFAVGMEEIRGKTDFEIFPAAAAQAFRENDERVIRSREVFELEEYAPHEDGMHTYVSIKFPILDKSGNIFAIGGVATDVTHLKRVEEQLRKANVFLDSVIEHIPDMIFIKEAKELRFVRFNGAGEELLGLSREELLGKNDYDLFPKEQADFFTAKDREVLFGSGYADVAVEPIDTRVHGRRYLHTKKIALVDGDGRPEFLLGISQDITEQREAQERLAQAHSELEHRVAVRTEELKALNEQLGRRLIQLGEAEEKFRLAVESAPSAMVMVDDAGKIVLVNAETERMFGYFRRELLGQPIEVLFPEHIRAQHAIGRDNFTKFAQGRVGVIRDLSGLRKDRVEIPIEISLNSLISGQGQFVLSAIVDVSNRKAADEFMRKALREKDLLLKEIHHRVKNNLQVISSLLKLQSAYLPDEGIRRLFRQADDRIRSMALIHERLYRSEGLVDIDLSAYVKELSQSLFRSYVVDSSRVHLHLELEHVFLGIDQAIPCGLILNEVVSNSLKHAFPPPHTGNVSIRLSLLGDDEVFLEVKDDGVGLPSNFDLLHPSSLGMEIIRTLAEQLDGTLAVEGKIEGDLEGKAEGSHGTAFALRFRRMESTEKRRKADLTQELLNS